LLTLFILITLHCEKTCDLTDLHLKNKDTCRGKGGNSTLVAIQSLAKGKQTSST